MRESTREALKNINGQFIHDNRISEIDLAKAIKKGQEDEAAIKRYEEGRAAEKEKIKEIAATGISTSVFSTEGAREMLKGINATFERNQEEGRKVIAGLHEHLANLKRGDTFEELLGAASQSLEAARSRYEAAKAAEDGEEIAAAMRDISKYENEVEFYKDQIKG